MANLKQIAATLAILGSGALITTGCEKGGDATEVPGGGDAPAAGDTAGDAADAAGDAAGDAGGDAAEAKCGEGHSEEGHCGAAEG